MTTKTRNTGKVDKIYIAELFTSLRDIVQINLNTSLNNSSLNYESESKKASILKPSSLFKESHNSASDEDDGGEGGDDDDNGEGSEKSNSKEATKVAKLTGNGVFVGSSIHYVDACTLWKFPIWLVDRLNCSKVIDNADTIHSQEIRQLILSQLKATSTDLIMYATVRREFLRTILVIELNNIARLLEVCKSLDIAAALKTNFFSSLKVCVTTLENESKPYNDSFVSLAQIMDDMYLSITPSVYFRDLGSYDYNNIYCSYLVPGKVMQFTEMCCGGIVDNAWFSFEGKYNTMVMVTPHVFDDPKGIQLGILKSEKYRVEAYFDVDHGHYTAFDKHFKASIPSSFRNQVQLEHLVFNYFSKNEHFVEEKSVFLMNGPETKGNLTFAKIYHSIVKTALL